MITAKIEIEGKPQFLSACKAALQPEAEFKSERAKYTLSGRKKLIISINSKDITAFRAILSSITTLLSIVDKNWRKING